jgi:hypothetical protein
MPVDFVFCKQNPLFNPFCHHGKSILDLQVFDLSKFYRLTVLDEGVPDGMDVDVPAFSETFFHCLLLNAMFRITRIFIEGFSSLRDSHPHPNF